MDAMIRDAIRKLPTSPTTLTEKSIKKIRKKILSPMTSQSCGHP